MTMANCNVKRLGPGGTGVPGVVRNSDSEEEVLLRTNLGQETNNLERSSGGGGDRRVVNGGRRRNGRGPGSGRGPKRRWTDRERKVLWECFVRSGGVWHGGYIEKLRLLWDEHGLSDRSNPSLISQLKEIRCGRHLSEMEKDEIRKKVETGGRMVISEAEWEEMFGESDVSEFSGFGSDGEDLEMDYEVVDGGENVVGRNVEMAVVQEDGVVDVSEANVEEEVTFREDGDVRQTSDEERVVFFRMKEVFESNEWLDVPSLKAQDRRKVNKEVHLVEGLMHNLVKPGMTVSEVNRLLYAGSFVVADRLGLIGRRRGKRGDRKKPRWQRRIERSIVEWRKDLGRVEELRKGTMLRKKVMDLLNRRYQIVEKGTVSVCTLLKGKIQSGKLKIRWYLDNCVKVRQNTLFKNNQGQLYKELGGSANKEPMEAPNAEDATQFWSNIWSVEKRHNEEASWLGEVKGRMDSVREQGEVAVSVDDVVAGIRKMANWKAPGPDGVRGFWFKRFRSLHRVIAESLQGCLDSGGVPDWIVKGRTVLIQKDHPRGPVASNYRPIACLPLMWKLLTGIFAEKLYVHLLENGLLLDEQKGCKKQSRGTKDQLLIDKTVLREAKVMKRSLAMGWIDYRKAYDMVPHSWIVEMLGLVKVAGNVKNLLVGSMANWKTVLTSDGEDLGEVGIRWGVFQGDCLSPLLFVICMMPLTLLLRREKIGYLFGREKRMLNHLLFMDDLKLYGRSEGDLEKLIEVVQVFSRYRNGVWAGQVCCVGFEKG